MCLDMEGSPREIGGWPWTVCETVTVVRHIKQNQNSILLYRNLVQLKQNQKQQLTTVIGHQPRAKFSWYCTAVWYTNQFWQKCHAIPLPFTNNTNAIYTNFHQSLYKLPTLNYAEHQPWFYSCVVRNGHRELLICSTDGFCDGKKIKCCILTMMVVRPFACCRIGRTDGWQIWRMCTWNEIGIPTVLESSIMQIKSLWFSTSY